MIAEEFLSYSLGLELNTDTETEEKMDENEEESAEGPKEDAEDVGKVGDLPFTLTIPFFSFFFFFFNKLSSACQFTCMVLW